MNHQLPGVVIIYGLTIVDQHIDKNLLGPDVINVLKLNIALDAKN